MLERIYNAFRHIGVKKQATTSKDTRTLIKSVKKLSPQSGDILCVQLSESFLSPNIVPDMTEAISDALTKVGCDRVALLFLDPGIGLHDLEDLLEKTKIKVEKRRSIAAAAEEKKHVAEGIL